MRYSRSNPTFSVGNYVENVEIIDFSTKPTQSPILLGFPKTITKLPIKTAGRLRGPSIAHGIGKISQPLGCNTFSFGKLSFFPGDIHRISKNRGGRQ
jgi:hypothetical protein